MDDSPTTRANLQAVLQQRPQLIRSVAYDGDPVTGLDVSPDGRSLAVYDRRGGLRLYDTTTWETLAEVRAHGRPHPAPVERRRWRSVPDGALLAAGPAGVVRDPILLLDAGTLEPAPSGWPGFPRDRCASSTSASARTARVGRHHPATGATGRLLVADVRPSSSCGSCATASDGCRWRCGSSCPRTAWFRWSRVALSPDGRTAYTSMPLSAYDVDSGRRLYTRARDVGGIGVRHTASNFFELNPAGTLLAVTETPDRLLLLDARTGRIRRELRGHGDQVRSLRFSHDGRSLASSSWDRTGDGLGRRHGRRPRAAAARRGRDRPGVQPRRHHAVQRRRGPGDPGLGPAGREPVPDDRPAVEPRPPGTRAGAGWSTRR